MDERPIGFFDSGVGGVSILNECLKILPSENYIFYADAKRAPYGDRCAEDIIRNLCEIIEEFFIPRNIKALVIGCNTATYAAVDILREKYDFPIIGTEPAIKVAMEKSKKEVLLLATQSTVNSKRLKRMLCELNTDKIMCLPCSGLMELIEANNQDGIRKYCDSRFRNIDLNRFDIVVLGCTHYPFAKSIFKEFFSAEVQFIDGGAGVSKRLKNILEQKNIRNEQDKNGRLEIYNSLNLEYSKKISTYVRR